MFTLSKNVKIQGKIAMSVEYNELLEIGVFMLVIAIVKFNH